MCAAAPLCAIGKYTTAGLQGLLRKLGHVLPACGIVRHAAVLQEQPPTHHLGLDLNMRSTGFAVLDGAGQVVRHGCFKAPTKATVLSSASTIVAGLRGLRDDVAAAAPTVWCVGIEDFMKTFATGRFQTRSLFAMAQLNGVVAFECMHMFGARGTTGEEPPREPLQVHPTRARTAYGLRKSGAQPDVKAAVYDFAIASEPRLAHASALHKRSGALSDENFDVTDAWLIARYTRHMHLAQVLEAQPELRSHFREELGSVIAAGLPKRQHEAALHWDVVLRELLLSWCVEADAQAET